MTDPISRLNSALGGRYRVEGEIGEGGMATVYLAEDLKHHRRVALKVLRPELAESLGAGRFLREIEIAASLTHPRIVSLIDSGSADGLLFYVMPYVDGESLRQRLDREKQLPVEEAIEIAQQVAAALAFAHEHGVVHRDVKPGNVLLTGGEAMVADFGVARAITAAGGVTLTESGVVVGTPVYMSPEQASGEHDLEPRSDIYGLGCVLYEMLAGEPPFLGRTAQAVWARKLSDTPPDVTVVRDHVPREVAEVVKKALARVPADRYSTSEDFARELRQARVKFSQPINGSSEERADPLVSRRSLLIGTATAGLAGLTGGAVLGAEVTSRPPPTYRRLTFRRGIMRMARFSPDYREILYGARWGGDVSRIYRVRPPSPQSYPLDLPPALPQAISSRGELALTLGHQRWGVLPSGTLARVPLAGGRPREIVEDVTFADWSPDGSELAVVRITGGRQRLEWPVGSVVAEPSGDFGYGFSCPRISPDGDRVALIELAGNPLNGRISTVDRQGNRTVLSSVSPNIFGLVWNGDEIWYTRSEERPLKRNAIHAISPDGTTRVVARTPNNAVLHDVAPDGRVLMGCFTEDRGGLSFRAPGESSERDLSWLDQSSVADIARDGSTLLFWESGVGGGPERSVYVREAPAEPAVRLGPGRALSLSPDGRWALTAEVTPGTPNDHLTLLPVGTGQPRRIERPGVEYDEGVGRWLPDGEWVLVYARQGDQGYRFHVQEVDGDGFRAVTPDGISVQGWALSPDGGLLAVYSDRGLELYPIEGGEPRPVPGPDIDVRLLDWIDDGLLVVPSEGPDEAADPSDDVPPIETPIDLLDPATGRRERWRMLRPRDPAGIIFWLSRFAVTPDGRSFAYSWHRALNDVCEVEGLT